MDAKNPASVSADKPTLGPETASTEGGRVGNVQTKGRGKLRDRAVHAPLGSGRICTLLSEIKGLH